MLWTWLGSSLAKLQQEPKHTFFLHGCMASAWLEVFWGWSASLLCRCQVCARSTVIFFGSSCRIWPWASQGMNPHQAQYPEGRGLSPSSATAQAEKIPHRVPRRQNPPQLWGKPHPWSKRKQLPHRATGTVAGGMSSSRSRGWQAGVAEAESSIIQNPSWAIGAFSSRTVQGTV